MPGVPTIPNGAAWRRRSEGVWEIQSSSGSYWNRRIEVIADDEAEIVEAVRRMSKNYDMLITSGGIGPTHDVRIRQLALEFNALISRPRTLHTPVFLPRLTSSSHTTLKPSTE